MSYTVIIPTHNRPEMVLRALRSVYAQSLTADQILIIDDASNPPLVLPSEFCRTQTRIIRRETPGGGALARNVGLDIASSDYIAFLDDDDEWLPEKMARQIAYLETHPEARLVSCGHFRIEGGVSYEEVFAADFVKRYFRYDNFLGSFSYLVIRKSEHRLDSTLPALQDWNYALRVIGHGEFGVVETPLVNYYAHNEPRITTRKSNRVRGLRKCYQEVAAQLDEDERRWWLSQIVFERSQFSATRSAQVRRVLFSIRLGISCDLPAMVKFRSLGKKAAVLFIGKSHLINFRSKTISLLQTLKRLLTPAPKKDSSPLFS